MIRGGTAADAMAARHTRARLQTLGLHGVFAGEDDGGRAVVDAGGVAGSDGPFGLDDRREPSKSFQRGVGAGMFVDVEEAPILFGRVGDGHGNDFAAEETGGARAGRCAAACGNAKAS